MVDRMGRSRTGPWHLMAPPSIEPEECPAARVAGYHWRIVVSHRKGGAKIKHFFSGVLKKPELNSFWLTLYVCS